MSGSTNIRSDVFPARVTISSPTPDGEPQVLDKVRVVVTLDAVYVFKDSAQGPVVAYTERLQSYDPGVPVHRKTRGTPGRMPSLVTDSGSHLTFVRTSGCGCGSRLKSFNPFPHTQQTLAATTDH